MGYVPSGPVSLCRPLSWIISALEIRTYHFSAVEEATKLAQVYQDILAMPYGFDTLIGEKGVSLSGGQKQRLAMSRAMILDLIS